MGCIRMQHWVMGAGGHARGTVEEIYKQVESSAGACAFCLSMLSRTRHHSAYKAAAVAGHEFMCGG